MGRKSSVRRWLTFNAVGAAGVVLQLAVLAFFVHIAGFHYLAATVFAVEAAILHNFVWHQKWTWHDRPAASRTEVLERLARFHLLNGGVSLAGNFALMAVLTGVLRMDPVIANLAAIAACSLVNFALSTTLVFRTTVQHGATRNIACIEPC